MIVTMNHYHADYESLSSLDVDAESMQDAISTLLEQNSTEPALIKKVGTGVIAAIPNGTIALTTEVSPTAAEEAGCVATPYTATLSKDGSVFLTAIPAEGYTFAGWLIDDDSEYTSTDESYELELTNTSSANITVTATAVFTESE